jgi:HSP20 family protein
MQLTKLNPWNWFKNEEASEAKSIPVSGEVQHYEPHMQLHQSIDRLLDHAFRDFGLPSLLGSNSLSGVRQSLMLKPNMDIESSDKEYTITVEVPGVEEDNIKLELVDRTLTIKGEKKQESEKKDKDVYRIERSYGSFQRVLSLPEDADQTNIDAQFKNGVLAISIPRKLISKPKSESIEIKRGV